MVDSSQSSQVKSATRTLDIIEYVVAHERPLVAQEIAVALGIPVSMFTCIFSLARTVGWIAQWQEMITDTEYRIGRPRQLYKGATRRDVVPIDKR